MPSIRGTCTCGALLLGLFWAGWWPAVSSPGRLPRHERPEVLAGSIGLRLLGAVVGYVIFTLILGIGDSDIFDWGGVLGALIGTLIVGPDAHGRAAHHAPTKRLSARISPEGPD